MEFMCYSTNMMAYVWSGTEYSILFWSLQIVITWINSWNLQSRQVIAMFAILLILLSFCLIFFPNRKRNRVKQKTGCNCQLSNLLKSKSTKLPIYCSFWRIQLWIISLLHYCRTRTSLSCTTNHYNFCISYLEYFRKLSSIF